MKQKQLNADSEFMVLCQEGNLGAIKDLLRDYPETDIFVGNNHGLIQAVKRNHIEVVDYLLNKTELANSPNIYNEQGAYLVACDNGNNTLIEKLFSHWLTHKNLQKIHPYIWEYGFSSAYVHANEFTMRFFLENPIMTPYINIHLEEDNCFITLYQLERKDLLKMLIIDFSLEKTQAITDFLNNPNRVKNQFGHLYKIDKEELKDLFEKRDFNNQLNSNLPEKNIKIKSKKI